MPPVTLSKSQYLGEQIKSDLAGGSFALGDKFLSVAEVSDRFDVSPATAHKVVSGLVHEGFLRAHRGKGFFLRRKPGRADLHPKFGAEAKTKTRRLLLINDFDVAQPPAKIMGGLQEVCRRESYRLEIFADTARFIEEASAPDVAGLVLWYQRDDLPLDKIDKPKISVGHWHRPAHGVISFIADAEAASIDVVRHLCGLRHENIALLLGDNDPADRTACAVTDVFISQIIAGMRQGFSTYGLTWRDQAIYASIQESQDQLVADFLATYRQRGITAVYVPNWETVACLHRHMMEAGLRAPHDLSVVVYGETPGMHLMHPEFTRIDLFMNDIAQQAVATIVAHDRDGKPLPRERFVRSSTELMPGTSTAMRIPESSTPKLAGSTP